MTLFEKFILNFGNYKISRPCKIENLPFIKDIEIFLNANEARARNGELDQCEILLRAISSLFDEEIAENMWQKCRRHEWHEYTWDGEQEKIVRRDDQGRKRNNQLIENTSSSTDG